jgi:hypothetical protein
MAWFGPWFGENWFGDWFGADAGGSADVTATPTRSTLSITAADPQVTATTAANHGGWPWQHVVWNVVAEPKKSTLDVFRFTAKTRTTKNVRAKVETGLLAIAGVEARGSTGATSSPSRTRLLSTSRPVNPTAQRNVLAGAQKTRLKTRLDEFETKTSSTALSKRQDFKIKTFSANVRAEDEDEEEFLLALFAVLDTEE